MKGGIAARHLRLSALDRAGQAPACDVVFHLVADEELGGAWDRALLEGRPDPGRRLPGPGADRPRSCASPNGACCRELTVTGPARSRQPAAGGGLGDRAGGPGCWPCTRPTSGVPIILCSAGPRRTWERSRAVMPTTAVAESCAVGVDRRGPPRQATRSRAPSPRSGARGRQRRGPRSPLRRREVYAFGEAPRDGRR